MKSLKESIQQRITDLESQLKASSAYGNQLDREPNYARDDMLIGMNQTSMAVNKRELVTLKSILNGGLPAQGACFPALGNYIHTNQAGEKKEFNIQKFVMVPTPYGYSNEYAAVIWEDGKEEMLSEKWFIGLQLEAVANSRKHVRII